MPEGVENETGQNGEPGARRYGGPAHGHGRDPDPAPGRGEFRPGPGKSRGQRHQLLRYGARLHRQRKQARPRPFPPPRPRGHRQQVVQPRRGGDPGRHRDQPAAVADRPYRYLPVPQRGQRKRPGKNPGCRRRRGRAAQGQGTRQDPPYRHFRAQAAHRRHGPGAVRLRDHPGPLQFHGNRGHAGAHPAWPAGSGSGSSP